MPEVLLGTAGHHSCRRIVSLAWHLLSPQGLPALTLQHPAPSISWWENKESSIFLTPSKVGARINQGTEKALNA